MKKVTKKSLMLLLKGVLVIALFSVIVFNMYSAKAVEKDYSTFDWDKFEEQNKENWTNYCENVYSEHGKDAQEHCYEELSGTLEKFYKKLYTLLTKYQEKGYSINDQVILWTVFIGQYLSPSTNLSAYNVNDYNNTNRFYQQWPNGYYGFAMDDSDGSDESVDATYSNDENILNFYKEEKDTLKILLRNALAYSTTCYGVIEDATEVIAEDGSKNYECPNGGVATDKIPFKPVVCADITNNRMPFWKFFVSRMQHDEILAIFTKVLFLGFTNDDEYYESCMELKNDPKYTEVHYLYNDDKEVDYEMYFDFLKQNPYFDGKANLQFYFNDIFLKADVDCLKSSVCENSLEAKGDEVYLSYQSELEADRVKIIKDILEILDNLGIGIQYADYTPTSDLIPGNRLEDRRAYYWPIGSDETEVRDGITYADGEPASTTILSYFGERKSPTSGKKEFHYGIDIAGEEGKTNVVAVEKGEVVTIVDNCSVGDYECNEGYGNMIILSHSNGDYTVYGLLHSIDSAVTVGTTVQKGQLIGKVGKTGDTLVPSLHFEIRKGGNSVDKAVNPTTITNSKEPRPAGFANGDFSMRKTSLTKEEFVAGLVDYCNRNSCSANKLGYFARNAELIYDVSVSNGLNPEFTVVRAIVEGFSPNNVDPSYHNYWGIGCTNDSSVTNCGKYSSLSDGISHLAQLGIVRRFENALDVFTIGHYAYIGTYWKNPGDSGSGGCYYFPYIREYHRDQARVKELEQACAPGRTCSGSSCMRSNDDDQEAYGLYNISSMSKWRYNIWGL